MFRRLALQSILGFVDVTDTLDPLFDWMVAGGAQRARNGAREGPIGLLFPALQRLPVVVILQVFLVQRGFLQLRPVLLQLRAHYRLHLLLELHDLEVSVFQFLA